MAKKKQVKQEAVTLDTVYVYAYPLKKQDCESEGGKWVKGKCHMKSRTATSKRKPSGEVSRMGKKRGRQRDWYPEKQQ